MPRHAHVNRIATAAPPHEGHSAFLRFARAQLATERERLIFDRLASRSGITSRYSVLKPSVDGRDSIDEEGLYSRGNFASTARRMSVFEREAASLAEKAIGKLELSAAEKVGISHLIVTSCTGMYAPGVDWDLTVRCGLNPAVERTAIGFMGCFAAVNALKLARHIVRSEPSARVLVVNVELCSLHLQEAHGLDDLLSFLLFGDGCAASLVSADAEGVSLDEFNSVLVPNTQDLITWKVGDFGFEMFLSGRVPVSLLQGLRQGAAQIFGESSIDAMRHWAVHPGGSSILNAVESAFELPQESLVSARNVLDCYGNMSSASVMFVLRSIMKKAERGDRGCGMSFGPGLTAETFLFRKV